VTRKKKRATATEKTGARASNQDKSPGNGPGVGKKRFRQIVFKDWCKKCGICRAFCPKNVIGQDESGGPVFERPEDCIGCRFCELHCPDFAITVQEIHTDPAGDLP